MIIRFFKTSYFSRLLVLVLLILVFWLPKMFNHSGNIILINTSYVTFNPWLQLLAIILFFFIMLFTNEIGTKHRLSDRYSFLTAFFFILTGSASGFLTQLSPFLLATFFITLLYQKIFDFQNSTKIIITAFDAGLFLGLASLFFPPAILLVLFVWFALLIYQSDEWRAYVTTILGVLLPWFFVFSGYFWFNNLSEALPAFLQYFHLREISNPFAGNMDMAMFLLVTLTTITAAFSLLGRLSSLNISLRQHTLVSLWGLLFISLMVLLFAVPTQALIITAMPAALILGSFFSRIKKLKWANLIVLLWLLFIFINHLLPLFHVA